MRKTKIVCTIGPASEDLQTLKEMLLAGMNVARLNFSHGSHEEHGRRIRVIRQAAEETGLPVAILLDTRGPEIRLGTFAQGKVQLVNGQTFTLTTGRSRAPKRSFRSAMAVCPGRGPGPPGAHRRRPHRAQGQGSYRNRRHLPGGERRRCQRSQRRQPAGLASVLPSMGPQDRDDIIFGIEQGVDFIAASFVRSAADVLAIRRLLEEYDSDIHIIAKIENHQGLDTGLHPQGGGRPHGGGATWGGDPPEEVPLAQKHMISRCNQLGKPVITATQMLDSMIRNPRPTRAEASDVANAIFDGTDAIMLSGRRPWATPVESVATMARLAAYRAGPGLRSLPPPPRNQQAPVGHRRHQLCQSPDGPAPGGGGHLTLHPFRPHRPDGLQIPTGDAGDSRHAQPGGPAKIAPDLGSGSPPGPQDREHR